MKIRHRIAFQQARIILVSSFLIGGLSAIVQFYLDLHHVRSTLIENIERSVDIYEPNIKQAVYNLDTKLAENVSKILTEDPMFTGATIYDDFGDLMAYNNRSTKLSSLNWLDKLSFSLLDVPEHYERDIVIDAKNNSKARLVVILNKLLVSQGLSNRAITLGVSGFIATISLSAILFLVFFSALSIPIQKISQWVAQLDHKDPDKNIPYTKQNELGDLAHNVYDIWRKKDEANHQVMMLAYYDPLTKLANRRMFTETLDSTLDNIQRSEDMGAVMYLDIDRFKTINDSLGHHIGDHLLVTVAERLTKLLPSNAMAARFGGDEFVLLLPNLSRNSKIAAERAIQLAERILKSISEPTQIGRNLIHCSTSIGITVYPQNPDSSSNILRRADTALYRVKAEGRNGFQFYDEGMQLKAKARWEIEEGLHKAIQKKELEIWLQPQVSSQGIITGAEVLLRWNHPSKGMVSPLEFISVAEESGQISTIEEWVLGESLRLLRTWKNEGLPDTFKRLSINISPAHFMQADFVARILPLLESFRIQGVIIEFEITENLLIDNFEQASETMATLQQQGISFAIDDFGTGYSSLRYLSQLPLNILKIDRSFISQIESSADDSAIVDVILLTAKKLGLEVIAEGVETASQQQSLAQRGCHLYQGFYFSKPLPHKHFFQLIKKITQ